MGWFEEQIAKRRKLDEATFEDSFRSLAGVDTSGQLDEKVLRENQAIAQVLSFYHHQLGDIPSSIVALMEKFNYALRPYEIQYHKVELKDSLKEGDLSPLLAFTKEGHNPVVLLPRGEKGYYYVNFKTGKKTRFAESIFDKLESEAYSFYRALPSQKVSLKEYIRYIRKSIRIWETVVYGLLSAAVVGVGVLLPYLTKILTGEVVQNKNIAQYVAVSIYVVATATGLLLLKAVQAFVNSHIAVRREKAIQEATMMRVLSLPPSFFKKYNTGEMTARFNAVPLLANTIVNGIFAALISTVMSLVYLFQLVAFAPVLILPVVLILVVSTSFTILVSVVRKGHMTKQLELSSKESGVTYEMINGIQKIRLSGSEKRVFAKWAGVYYRSARTMYTPPLIIRLAPAINLLITLLGNVAIYFLAVKHNVAVDDYMAFVTSYGILSAAFASVGNIVQVAFTVPPLFELARPILSAESENLQGKIVMEHVNGNIRFDNVSFQYNEGGPDVLDHLSLDIREGEYVAIVGKTGCGKSTLVRLLLGFEKPTDGAILYDDIPMNDIDLPSLRRKMGTVMQGGNLFHADILSNIIISAPNLTEKDAWEAAEIADIAKDIRAMPMKMKTVISEGQGGISGGQKQRIMIARAIVHRPKILIFDEATSALDNKTQRSISEAIDKLNCTRIVIAHRLSTIQNADRILMLENGRVVESGDYKTLIAEKGRFAELVERQRLDTK